MPSAEPGLPEAPLLAECDILVPAARGDVITEADVGRVQARLVLEGANLPISAQADATLHDCGVLCIPDWIANAGGVICGSVEYRGGTRAEAFSHIDDTVRENTAVIVERSLKESIPPRRATDSSPRAASRGRCARGGTSACRPPPSLRTG